MLSNVREASTISRTGRRIYELSCQAVSASPALEARSVQRVGLEISTQFLARNNGTQIRRTMIVFSILYHTSRRKRTASECKTYDELTGHFRRLRPGPLYRANRWTNRARLHSTSF